MRDGEESLRDEYVFIGSVCAGKSTVAEAVAAKIGLPHAELDAVANDYYGAAPGFEGAEFDRLRTAEGMLSAYRYFETAAAFAVERFVEEYRDFVLDLGAGHSCYLDPTIAGRAITALQPFRRKVLLLPSPDKEASIVALRAKCVETRDMDWVFDGFDFIRHWVEDGQNEALADLVVYTEGRTPEEIAEEIIAKT